MSREDIMAAVSVLSAGRLTNLEEHVEQLAAQAGSAPPRSVATHKLQRLAHASTHPTLLVR